MLLSPRGAPAGAADPKSAAAWRAYPANTILQSMYLPAVVCRSFEWYEREYRQLPAEQASAYFRDSARRFNELAVEKFLPVLDEPRAGDLALLSAVAYVATREVRGHTAQLQEILTTRRRGPDTADIHTACLEALLATTDDRAATARFLAELGAQADPPPGRQLCIAGLRRLEPEAGQELFACLGRCPAGAQRRRLALLVQRVTGLRSPVPLNFWRDTTDPEQSAAAAANWTSQAASSVRSATGAHRVGDRTSPSGKTP